MNRLRARYPLVLVTVTGAVVMGLEILGTRVIGTFYGASLFVWGSLLTVTLVSLALGYAVGGVIADRWPHAWVLYSLVLLAGLAALAIPATQVILEPCFDKFGLRAGALMSAFAIFTAPLTLLGLASPYVVRLRARSIKHVGAAAGSVFAVSTVGSVAGTLLTSFYLIPQVGTRWSLAINAGALVLVAACGLVVSLGLRTSPAVLLVGLSWVIARGGPPASEMVLYRTESPYGRIAVVRYEAPGQRPYRMLFVGGVMQTGMPLDIGVADRGSLLRSDSYYLELLPYYHGDPDVRRKCLLIGLAGGMFARAMEPYPIELTAVETDVKLAEIAKAYFGYRGRIYRSGGREYAVDLSRFPRRGEPVGGHGGAVDVPEGREPYAGRAIIDDGRRFLESSSERYDFIVLDAYSSDAIPFHLITREMFLAVRKHLTHDGILAINYIGRPVGDVVTDSLARTLVEVFGSERVAAFCSTDDRQTVQVIYFFAFCGATEPLPRWHSTSSGPDGGVDPLTYELTRRRLTLRPSRGLLITDDHNPIDAERVGTALAWRAQTLGRFGHLRLHEF